MMEHMFKAYIYPPSTKRPAYSHSFAISVDPVETQITLTTPDEFFPPMHLVVYSRDNEGWAREHRFTHCGSVKKEESKDGN